MSAQSNENSQKLPSATLTAVWKKLIPSFCNASPSDIINLIDVCQTVKDKMAFEGRVKYIASKICEATAAHKYFLSGNTMDDTTLGNVLQLTSDDAWKIKDLRGEERFKSIFQVTGKHFSKCLRHCLYVRDQKKDAITDDMYQELFTRFLLLFDIHCEFSVGKSKECIQGQTVTADPDLVAKWYRRSSESILEPEYDCKTIFVCQVIKELDRADHSSPKKLRLNASLANSESMLPDLVMGKHCGELLLHYRLSLAKDTIIGMVLDKTCVSFTALLATEKQFKNFIDGSSTSNEGDFPEMICSRPFDFMNKEDRDELIEPLLKLGFIQDIGEQSFN